LDEQALAMRRRLASKQAVAYSLNNLAVDLRALGELERARQLDEEASAMLRRIHDGDHPDLAISHNNLTVGLPSLGDVGLARLLDD
jgi:Tetratricopeptide repeat